MRMLLKDACGLILKLGLLMQDDQSQEGMSEHTLKDPCSRRRLNRVLHLCTLGGHEALCTCGLFVRSRHSKTTDGL